MKATFISLDGAMPQSKAHHADTGTNRKRKRSARSIRVRSRRAPPNVPIDGATSSSCALQANARRRWHAQAQAPYGKPLARSHSTVSTLLASSVRTQEQAVSRGGSLCHHQTCHALASCHAPSGRQLRFSALGGKRAPSGSRRQTTCHAHGQGADMTSTPSLPLSRSWNPEHAELQLPDAASMGQEP